MLPIAVDAMGGDHPDQVLEGVKAAAREYGIPVILVGDPATMGDTTGCEIFVTTEVISMDEEPGAAVRNKKDSSLVRCAELVRDGKASAMISAGNTGAAMASALLRLGRLSKVARPAIATPIPVPGFNPTVLLDCGANADCQPQWLVQFAQMGSVYSRVRFGVANPRVALLSIGEEDAKGNQLVKSAHKMLREAEHLNFTGNVEGRDFLRPHADVVVADGFTGNVVLKTLEGSASFVIELFRNSLKSSLAGKLAGLAIKSKLKPKLKELDPNSYGGAMLLGVNGVCIISHGSSKATAMKNAIVVTRDLVEADLVEQLRQAVTPAPEPVGAGELH
jgi:phosphate acyltransferase